MMTGQTERAAELSSHSAVLADSVMTASCEYRSMLQEKAAAMRAAVTSGETEDARVLAVAETLERLAANEI
jgi:hypothetical protein